MRLNCELNTKPVIFLLLNCLKIEKDKMAEMKGDLQEEFCNVKCPADESKFCGGNGTHGAISVYPNFPADSMAGVGVTAKNVMGLTVNGSDPEHNLLTGEELYLNVSMGDYYCHAANPDTCSSAAGNLPPVNITVDYGDGSGIAKWTRENTQDLWRHAYVRSGTYNIAIVGKSLDTDARLCNGTSFF